MRLLLLIFLATTPLLLMGQSIQSASSKWKTPVKKSLAFKISVPEGNFLHLNKGNKYGSAFGFLGISGGFEYYFSDKYNVNMDFGALSDFPLPFPAPLDREGDYHQSYAFYADLQIGTDIKRFHFDAGLQYNKTSYKERETVQLFPVFIDTLKYSKKQGNLGAAFSTYFRVSRSFNIGINYYPSFVAFDEKVVKTHYSHLLFLELVFRIRAYSPKK